MDAILAIQWVLNGSTGSLSLPFRNRRLTKTATTIATRVLGSDKLLRELRFGNVVKEHDLARENLPFIAKNAKVVEFRYTIAGQGLSTPKVAQHSNSVSKRCVTAVLKVDTDEFVEGRNDDLLAWVLGAQVNLEPALGLVHVLEVVLDWKATKRRELSLVLKVDPVVVVRFRQDWIRGPFDLENVITDTDGRALDVTPETN
jgi:hypothetical protein